MPAINMSSILKKGSEWKNSDEGKRRCKDKIKEYVENGVERTQAGSTVLTEERMRDIADDFIYELRSVARKYNASGDIPDDILAIFEEDLFHSYPVDIGGISGIKSSNYYVIDVVFDTDLYRPSLEPDRWDGVDNIIKLFDDGYSTGSFTVGYGRTVTGETFRKTRQKQVRGYWPKAGKIVWSVSYRPHLGFMQEAIDWFNKRYAGTAHATLMWD